MKYTPLGYQEHKKKKNHLVCFFESLKQTAQKELVRNQKLVRFPITKTNSFPTWCSDTKRPKLTSYKNTELSQVHLFVFSMSESHWVAEVPKILKVFYC